MPAILLHKLPFRAAAILCLATLTGQISACARFRIEELSPATLFSLAVRLPDAPNPEQMIQAEANGRVYYNFPLAPATGGALLYVADPARRLVRVFGKGSDQAQRIIAEALPPGAEDIRLNRVKLGVPGLIAADEEGEHVYIQSFQDSAPPRAGQPAGPAPAPLPAAPTPAEDRNSGQVSDIRIRPSQILHLDEDGKLLGALGVDGYNSASFEQIERLTADEEGLLYVLHRNAAQLTLSVFRDGALVGRYAGFPAATDEERTRYLVEIEDIAPGPRAEFAIYCAAMRRRGDFELVERIIYRRNGYEGQPLELLRSDDAQDFFGWSRPDGGFYLIKSDEDGAGALFKVFSPDGEYLNNQQIVFPGMRASWRDTYLTMQGRILTSRLYLGRFELYEWK
ncbi:MAG: hypothetical protein K1X75_06920 [Leptospirales bacterium]|nr:hypothetical protein [Leptospirales bacterium]